MSERTVCCERCRFWRNAAEGVGMCEVLTDMIRPGASGEWNADYINGDDVWTRTGFGCNEGRSKETQP